MHTGQRNLSPSEGQICPIKGKMIPFKLKDELSNWVNVENQHRNNFSHGDNINLNVGEILLRKDVSQCGKYESY